MILVTGGAGFIGANFVMNWLGSEGAEGVVNLDKLTYAGNLSTLDPLKADFRHFFVHGFLVLSPTAEFLYKTTDYYHPQSEVCLTWDDPTVAIQWPLASSALPNLNTKDSTGLSWEQAPKFE